MKPKLLSLFALLLVSCNGNSVYKTLDTDFDDNRWPRTDVKTYDFQIEKDGSYNLAIVFSHVAGIQFAEIPLNLELSDGHGVILAQPVMLRAKDAQGNDIGDCAGDFCDMEQVVFTAKPLAAGSYKIRLANAFEHEYLPNVIGIGINLTNADTK